MYTHIYVCLLAGVWFSMSSTIPLCVQLCVIMPCQFIFCRWTTCSESLLVYLKDYIEPLMDEIAPVGVGESDTLAAKSRLIQYTSYIVYIQWYVYVTVVLLFYLVKIGVCCCFFPRSMCRTSCRAVCAIL